MTEPMSPADLYRHSLRLLLDKDIEGWVELCDENVKVEFPYAPEGFPSQLDGRASIAEFMRGYPDHFDLREIPSLQIHETTDRDTIVAEWRGTGRVVATGAPYDMAYVSVVTVRDGHITHNREYWNLSALPGSADDAKFFL
ncbi:nuclear transport factor 2 family protein [Streptomyces sp. NBC_00481]|uniref:nuclear transport factor 2 family protein n=1 Tax=unclassified Streptomyces TaxID=2593676 RepID=UPI002DD881BB|nr:MULTISPECIES: nuclear transport factor 2 family protein [unclassified Streptomyces]WRY94016.1 nuclear transport factor 2 family protein [Streptomyces sp. NBC_00481]